MDYFHLLNSTQKKNIAILIQELRVSPITNELSRAAALAVSSKESNFLLQSEKSYRNTPNDRIRAIFGTHFKGISDADLDVIKADDKKFFDDIYGGLYGNAPDEGYKYRGRGYHDTTFKGNYKKASDNIKIDLVTNPDRLNEPEVAAKELIWYFTDRFEAVKRDPHLQEDLHSKDINGFTTLEDALVGFYRANAGWGKSIFPDNTGGFAKAHDRVQGFLDIIQGKLNLA